MNPYWGADLFSFFFLFFQRMFSGEMWRHLASDEIQLFTIGSVAAACGVVGPFLVLRKMTMLANSLSHTLLLGLVGATLLIGGGSLVVGGLLAAFLTVLLTEGVHRLFRIPEDASIGLIFTTLFAIALCLIALFLPNTHLSIEAVMGNPDMLKEKDLLLSVSLLIFNVVAMALLFERFRLTTFDAGFARSLHISISAYQHLLLLITSCTLVAGFRAVGLILVLGFLTGPYLTVRLFSSSLQRILIFSPLLGFALSAIGVALSRHLLTTTGIALSTSGIVSTLLPIAYFIAVALRRRVQLRA